MGSVNPGYWNLLWMHSVLTIGLWGEDGSQIGMSVFVEA